MNKRADTTILVTLFSLILVIIVGGAIASGVSNMLKKDLDNTRHYETLAYNIQRIVNQHTAPYTEEYSFQFDEPHLFMFFSTGEDSIKLIGEHSFEFERPEECEEKACFCYCDNNKNFWFVDEPTKCKLKPQYLVEENIYSCPFVKCTIYEEPMYFLNSRGRDKEYIQQVQDLAKKAVDKKIYEPIPLEIPIIIHSPEYISHDLFFSQFYGVDYNLKEQDRDIVIKLVSEYKWEGGVVVGAMGMPMTAKDNKNFKLRAPYIDFTIEKHSQSIYGICIYPKCLFDSSLKVLEEEQRVYETNQKARGDIEVNFNIFDSYVRVVHPNCLPIHEDAELCAKTFAEHLQNIFSTANNDIKPRVIWKQNPPPLIDYTVELYINDELVDNILDFSHPFPVVEYKPNTYELIIVHAENTLFELEDSKEPLNKFHKYSIVPYTTKEGQETIQFKLS